MEGCASDLKEILNIGPEDNVSRVSYRSWVSYQSKVSGKNFVSIMNEIVNQSYKLLI